MKARMILYVLAILGLVLISTNVFSADYEEPPSIPASGDIPYISDAQMEECVKTYNESNWLSEEIKKTTVNKYSQASIDEYNSKVSRLLEKTSYFNDKCAGKQSESAYKAAKKLNEAKKLNKLYN